MGGDHKCPVCQATFTRPQHVARHMRSHTGDRPYKCQFCGDQFARSDLLSRHVNKCHANEKPLVNTSTRRKGSASTSRATTSKQACDQCVQSSLPCDGSNPCAKCVQRKYRCTYVKFHRQTAPVGPGHQPPRSTSSVPPQPSVQVPSLLGSTSSASSRYPIYSEDFVMSGSSAAAAASGSYPGHAQVSAALHDALYPSQSPTFPYASSLYTNGSVDPATEYQSRYSRSHEDLYRTSPTSSLAPSSASGSAPSSWVSGSQTAGGWPPAGQHSSSSSAQQDYHHGHHASQLERPVYTQSQHTLAPHQQHAAASGGQPTTSSAEGAHFREIFAEEFAPGPRRGSLAGSLSDGYGHHSEGTDGSGSENGGGGYYAAASSSNVRGKKGRYLDETIAGIDQPSPFSFDPHDHGHAGSSSSSSHHYSDSGSDRPGSTHSIASSLPRPPGTASSTTSSTGAPPGSATSGTFFNAFDSLSIDDPAVLAQLAANGGTAPDGSPFFAHMNLDHIGSAPGGGVGFPGGDSHADPDATPMPIKEEPSGGVRFAEGSRIQRPLSSLAALQPSSTNGLNWNSYLGLGTPSANSNNASMGFLGGWTPGGGNGGNNTLAGLDMAGVPSFGTGLTPGKDMDSKEMREFWKQYLKTPLTTGGDPMDTTAGGDSNAPSTPFRRPRVTSMPSSNKTPLAVDRDRLNAANHQYYQQRHGGLGPTSSMRTTLHPSSGGKTLKEDLGSYEAAVLARKTPINLSMGRLSSRRRGGSVNPPGGSTSGLSKASSSGDNLTVQVYPGMQRGGGHEAARQMMHHHHQQLAHTNGSDGDTSASASPASRASSLAADGYPSPFMGYASSPHDVDMEGSSRPTSSAGLGLQRPTVKRVASSVLESGTPKAMKFDDTSHSPSSIQPLGGSTSGNPATSIALPRLHPVSSQSPVQPLGSVNSLPPISTNVGYNTQKPGTMMAPPPPSSAPPMSGSVLNMNLPRGSLAERRRMSAAAGGEMRK